MKVQTPIPSVLLNKYSLSLYLDYIEIGHRVEAYVVDVRRVKKWDFALAYIPLMSEYGIISLAMPYTKDLEISTTHIRRCRGTIIVLEGGMYHGPDGCGPIIVFKSARENDWVINHQIAETKRKIFRSLEVLT